MYSVDDIIVGVNAETAAAVGVGGVTMEFMQAEVADATPTNLRRGAPSRRATTSWQSSGGAARSRLATTRFLGTLRPFLLPLSLRLALAAARTRARSPPPRRRPRGWKVLPKRSRV